MRQPPAARLRRRLLLLATAAIVPLAIACGLSLGALLRQQAGQTERTALDLTRAMAAAVENELRLTISALQALALADSMGSDQTAELAKAHRLSIDAVATRPEWRALLLIGPGGRVIFGSGAPFGTPLPDAVEPDSLQQVFRTGQPSVGLITSGPAGNLGIPVRVPVIREGRVVHVLTAVLRTEAVHAVVMRQRIPTDWVVSVFDARQMRVARSRDHERFVGQPATVEVGRLLQATSVERQAFGAARTLEGTETQTAVSRLALGEWTVALGLPTAAGARIRWTSILFYSSGIVLSALLAGIAAWRVSRGIERPIERLREAALALGRGQRITDVPTGIAELDTMSQALVTASVERTHHAVEREGLLAAERAARSAAEQAQRRTELLVQAGTLLSQPLDEHSVLQAIAGLIVPGLADACRIDLLDAAGTLQRKITHHVDPERRRLIEAFVARTAASAATPGTFPWAIETGQSFMADFPDPDDVPLADEKLREFARLVGIRSAFVTPLIARGQTLGAMAVMQAESGRRLDADDAKLITELAQRAALALDNVRLLEESRTALDEASVANRAKDEFMAMLGHELRNPLAPIVTSLQLMSMRDPGSHATERKVIERQVRHMSRLVDDLLDVSRIASGKVQLQCEVVSLQEIVQASVEATRPVFAARQALRVSMPAEPLFVDGDPARLTQVLNNLLLNGAKFSAPDREVGIDVRRDGEVAVLTVQDEGIGIDPALLPRIFDRFVQGDQALHRDRGGLGLGLAIARGLVELHQGTIEAHSGGPDQGSRFVVRLPLTPKRLAAVAAEVAAKKSGPALRVLVVDDNSDAAESLSALLAFEGHEVHTAWSSAAALDQVSRFAPDAAILDIGLPQIDGYRLAGLIRSTPGCERVRLIALTGFGQASDRSRALDAGFESHFVKPVDIDALLSVLAAK